MTLPPFLQRWGLLIGLVLLAVILLGLAYCSGRDAGRDAEASAGKDRTIQAERQIGAANTKAADARVDQAKQLEQQRKELDDARIIVPGDSADDARARYGCRVMQQQGRDPNSNPTCRRLAGPVGTPVP